MARMALIGNHRMKVQLQFLDSVIFLLRRSTHRSLSIRLRWAGLGSLRFLGLSFLGWSKSDEPACVDWVELLSSLSQLILDCLSPRRVEDGPVYPLGECVPVPPRRDTR